MTSAPPVAASIDLEALGKRIGHLELVWSDDSHAYGVIPVPIAVIAAGTGPTALVTAGVHGDEYEGLLIARRLIAEIGPGDVSGRLIVMPALNLPAVRSRTRTSPIDRANLNRAFPGSATGGPTAMIADFVERRLLPRCQWAIDLHSGGTQSVYAPCGYIYGGGAAELRQRKLAAAHAFGAPLTAVVRVTASSGSLSAAAERHGVALLACELSGGAMVDAAAYRTGWQGTLNLLRHAGVLNGAARPARTALRHTPGRAAFVMAPVDGLFEPAVSLGHDVEAGALAGRIWPMDDPLREPVPVRVALAGTVLARRTMPMVTRGDTLLHTGAPISDEDYLAL